MRHEYVCIAFRIHLYPLPQLPLGLRIERLYGIGSIDRLPYLLREIHEREYVLSRLVQHPFHSVVFRRPVLLERLEPFRRLFPVSGLQDLIEIGFDCSCFLPVDIALKVPDVMDDAALVLGSREEFLASLGHAAEDSSGPCPSGS